MKVKITDFRDKLSQLVSARLHDLSASCTLSDAGSGPNRYSCHLWGLFDSYESGDNPDIVVLNAINNSKKGELWEFAHEYDQDYIKKLEDFFRSKEVIS